MSYDTSPLPGRMTCLDCAHFARCRDVLGCTWHSRRHCDWSPSRFVKALTVDNLGAEIAALDAGAGKGGGR